MSIALVIALLSAVAALTSYITQHPFLCGFHIFMAIIFIIMAMGFEGRTLNRIQKLEEELNNLKRRY